MKRFRTQSPWTAGLAILAALALLGMAITLGRAPMRADMRRQLARRDASIVAALVEKQLGDAANADEADPLVVLLDAATIPGLPGVLGARLHAPEGTLFATLLGGTNAAAGPDDALIAGATHGEMGVRYVPEPDPRLDLAVPLHDSRGMLVGIAAMTLDASGLAAEYRRLDASLARQGWLAFGVLGGAMALVLGIAFQRLQRLNRLLEERSERLVRANRELALASKTSAVGAVASHLVHGLRNPLLALQHFVSQEGRGDAVDQADAAATARRMKAMLDDVVRVLRDEQGLSAFEISAAELCGELERRLRPALGERPVRLQTKAAAGPPLDNRTANLALLVLENLATNAFQAIDGPGVVRVEAERPSGTRWCFRVSDSGTGIGPEAAGRLFTPQESTKPGGTGLGLALSRQLARHLGGDLRLDHTGPSGTTFLLELPGAVSTS